MKADMVKYAVFGYAGPVVIALFGPELWLHLHGVLPDWYLPLAVVAGVVLTRGDRADFLRCVLRQQRRQTLHRVGGLQVAPAVRVQRWHWGRVGVPRVVSLGVLAHRAHP